MAITPTGKTTWLECVCMDENLALADIEETHVDAKWTLGAKMRFKTEFGTLEAVYTRNESGARATQGMAAKVYEKELSVTGSGGALNTFTHNTTYAADEMEGAMFVVKTAGAAAPIGEVGKIKANSAGNASTSVTMTLDRNLTTALANGDAVLLQTWTRVEAFSTGTDTDAYRLFAGCWANACATDYYGWVVTAGYHPKVHIAGDIDKVNTHIAPSADSYVRQAATVAVQGYLPMIPLTSCDASANTHYPFVIRDGFEGINGLTL